MSQHYCYILYNDINNTTYNGYTNNLERRLRQHNGDIKGGARYTTNQVKKNGVIWKYACIVSSEDPRFDRKKALSLEFHIRYPTNKRPRPRSFIGREGRIKGLELALAHPKFQGISFDVKILPMVASLGEKSI